MAITYGMSVKEFWEDNPDLFWAYRFSYCQKLETNRDIHNYNAWLQGAYFLEAVSVALNNGFSKEKIKYSDKPYSFNEEKQNENKEDKIKMQVADLKARISQVNKIRSAALKEENKGGEEKK